VSANILSHMFTIKNGLTLGDAVSPLLFNFALEYAIRRVQVSQDGLKINGTHHHPVYTDDVNILGGSVHNVKKNTDASVVASRESGPEVNVSKTKYLVMSRDRNVGQSHNLKIYSSSFERVEKFKFWGKTIQNYVQEEFKKRLRSGNYCYHPAQNLLSFSLLSKNIKIKV